MADDGDVIELVVFDLAGTTVDDSINGLPLVTVAMKEAFIHHGIVVTPEQVNQVRGMEKKEAIRRLLHADDHDATSNIIDKGAADSSVSHETYVELIFQHFKSSLDAHLNDINREISGTTATFEWLQSKGIKVALGSGFPHSVVMALVEKLSWNDVVDFASSAEHEGHGRPDPALIRSAMKQCGVTDPRRVIKVGDTVVDVEEGRNAGCLTVAVLTGTQSETKLKTSCPDFILESVAELPRLIEEITRH